MNDDERSPGEPEDTELAEAFAQLRRLEPSMSARLANRAMVATALRVADAARERRWWRRSISVPMPVAASLLALLAITASISAAAWLEARQPDESSAAIASDEPKNRDQNDDSRSVERRRAARVSGYSATETYLCGIGRIQSNSRYSQTENTP